MGPDAAVRKLRQHGATTQLAIADARDALQSMISGGPGPFAEVADTEFLRSHPELPEFCKYNPDDLAVPFRPLRARLDSALAWHQGEALIAESLHRMLTASNVRSAEGAVLTLPPPVIGHIGAYILGDRVFSRSRKSA